VPRRPWRARSRWQDATYSNINGFLKNPVYAGRYTFGRTVQEPPLEGSRRRGRQCPQPPASWIITGVEVSAHHAPWIYGRLRFLHERVEVGDDLLGTLPVRAVAGVGVDLEARPGDHRRQAMLVLPRKERVPLTPEDEGRRGDPPEPVYSDRPRVFAKLWAIPGVRRWQVGDQEMRAVFPPETLEQVAG
jgi:hypothetical protein